MLAHGGFCRVLSSSLKITKMLSPALKQCSGNHIHSKPLQICIPFTSIQRHYTQSQPQPAMSVVDFDYVKKATSNNKVVLIDVREPDELKEHGVIPNSINIPLHNVEAAFTQLSDEQFKNIYKKPKPTSDTEIIFFCMIGKRSGKAQETALKLGFKNVKNYLGSFNDWKVKYQS